MMNYIKVIRENYSSLLKWLKNINDDDLLIKYSNNMKQDRRWNAEKPSATLDP